jgi:hypothetical protein
VFCHTTVAFQSTCENVAVNDAPDPLVGASVALKALGKGTYSIIRQSTW